MPPEEPALDVAEETARAEDRPGSDPPTPPRSAPGRTRRLSLLGVLAFFAVLLGVGYQQARLITQPEEVLLELVPDDAFYYLQIARHFAAGDGSTFDGENRASGYHPGWMALLVPVAAAQPASPWLLRSALALSFLFHAAAAFASIGLMRRFTTPGLAIVGGICWLLNPFALLLSLQGVESALYAFALVVLLRTAARFVAAETASSRLHLALAGALAFCFYARTEAGILAVVTFVAAPALRGMSWREILRSAFRLGLLFTLLVLPWFLFCWMATGSPWQSSGAAKWLWGDRALGDLGFGARLGHALSFLGLDWLQSAWRITAASPLEKLHTFTWAATVPALLALFAIGRGKAHRPLLFATLWLLAATLATGLVYGLFHSEFQIWYYTQPALFLFLLTFLWIARLAEEPRRLRRFLGVALPAVLLALSFVEAGLFYRFPRSLYPWQFQFLTSQHEFEKLVPAGEPIGCFNAGIPAFYSRGRVINLDGLVNSTVLPYYRARRFDRYLLDHGIHYIADVQPVLARTAKFMESPLRLHPIAAVELKGWYAPYRFLWQVGAER